MTDQDTRADQGQAKTLDPEAAAELKGVPADLIDGEGSTGGDQRIAELEQELATAKQDILYARAETQNVRRRMEKDVADARAYAATGFARDMLSVSDNLARAL